MSHTTLLAEHRANFVRLSGLSCAVFCPYFLTHFKSTGWHRLLGENAWGESILRKCFTTRHSLNSCGHQWHGALGCTALTRRVVQPLRMQLEIAQLPLATAIALLKGSNRHYSLSLFCLFACLCLLCCSIALLDSRWLSSFCLPLFSFFRPLLALAFSQHT